MPLQPLPIPKPPWISLLIALTQYAYPTGYAAAEYVLEVESPDDLEWRRMQLVIEDLQSTVAADDSVITMDFQNWTSEVPDSTWTTADYEVVETQIHDTFVLNMVQSTQSRYRYKEMRWYRRRFAALEEVSGSPPQHHHFLDSGPPERITPINVSGAVNAYMPPQVACSVTEETAHRASWGRFYIPGLPPAHVVQSGRWATGTVDFIAGMFNNVYFNVMAADIFPVVPQVSAGGNHVHGLLTVTGIRVDDVPDVIRRRRPKYANYRKQYPLASGAGLAPLGD